MNKIIRFIQTYLIIGLPFVIGLMVWNTIQSENEIYAQDPFIFKIIFNLLAFNLMFWFVALISYLIMLVIIPSVRENTLRRLANLNERDEREEYITGKSARAAYLSTLSLIILFLFFSLFSINIYKEPKTLEHKAQMSVNIGLHFDLTSKSQIEKSLEGDVIFESRDIPLSKSAIILILICWQLAVFNMTARKIDKKY